MKQYANMTVSWLLVLAFILLSRGAAAQPAATAPVENNRPNYPVPYTTPTPEQIKQVMDRVRDRLDARIGSRLLDARTGEPATDLSKPLQVTIGPEHGVPVYSYPTGVAYSGLLLANEVTGDPKYAEVVTKRFQMFHDNLP